MIPTQTIKHGNYSESAENEYLKSIEPKKSKKSSAKIKRNMLNKLKGVIESNETENITT